MAKKTKKRLEAKKKPLNTRKVKRTGKTKKKAQARLGKAVFLTTPVLKTAEAAKAWLYDWARNELASGYVARAEPKENAGASKRIAKLARANITGIKGRGVPELLIDGALLVAIALDGLADVKYLGAGVASSQSVMSGADFAAVCRSSLLRVMSGPRHAEARRKFGFGNKLNAKSPASVVAVCKGLLAGRKALPSSPAAEVLTEDDAAMLQAIVKSIGAEQATAAVSQTASSDAIADRDIYNAALELFYDKFAAAISMALFAKPKARVDALKLIPRRAEQRGDAAEKAPVGGSPVGDAPASAGQEAPDLKSAASVSK